ncbi:MAG: 50S ribosomal protein L29 [Treponema porcinum]|uniref:Large ribosomal subunit protein uL29 n=1 Tax=Treponema porcinum TaxID=261392 RepID=A0A1T4K4A1_TREPO|nr:MULTISPECIES: 50S ribosomal protein L29 [Treponema]MCI5645860.1 50S ribosomal protein L29 [Treponema porcinum]MCI6321937.1 50S ribosomal protein L29 [Treponema porcinum]MCI6482008.1 50S ribosomal protein L29 [Treponema porcinum]MCI6815579.1 50S ribosomal protein L29 [Treponema porcinum]MCI6982997.1 50S ribosomal protein L29 [Treponema porcinum]
MADSKSKKKNDKELSYSELVAKRDALKKEYMDLRFKMVVAHVDNPMQKRTMRREIARLNTFIQQKEAAGENK